mgnify:CR=1 FL=1
MTVEARERGAEHHSAVCSRMPPPFRHTFTAIDRDSLHSLRGKLEYQQA